MCGIVGIFHPEGLDAESGIIRRMTESIVHRGPDEEGYHIDDRVHLGVRRLSIVDIGGGRQPIYDDERNLCIVYNGELYNSGELRKQLQQCGQSFRTRSDTEVVLKACAQWGTKGLARLKGMFAFALWNTREKRLILVRDRLGIKPLYYAMLPGGTLLFASEIKALLLHPGMEARIYPKAVDNMLTYGFNIAPHTFFDGIRQLLPGHLIQATPDEFKMFEYADIDLTLPVSDADEEDLAAELRFQIRRAVESGLASDVPVAAYLSGGIDSSTVAGMYSELAEQKIRTLSITFENADYDEKEFAREVSRHFQTDHLEFQCRVEHGDLQNLVYHLEEPMVTLLYWPLHRLSRQAAEMGFKVVLSGDGADEILGGYDYFRLLKAMNFIEKQESPFRKNILRRVFPKIKTNVHAEIQHMLFQGYTARHPAMPYRFQVCPFKEQMYSDAYKETLGGLAPDDPFYFDMSRVEGRALIDQALYIETKMRLLNMTLPLADKMSMANSVEVRPLLMDHELVDFVFSIPAKYKISGLSEKHILKKSMEGFLPGGICSRKKQPLQPPGAGFIRATGEMGRHYLSESVVREKGYFNPAFISKAIVACETNQKADFSGILVVALMMHLWDDVFLKSGCYQMAA